MKIKSSEKISVIDGLGELEFYQFLQVANFFGINVIDKTESKSEDGSIDPTKVKTRRDFDVMAEEIKQAYLKLSRHSRRSIDRIFTKIILANRKARKIIHEGQVKAYTAAAAQTDEVIKAINQSNGGE